MPAHRTTLDGPPPLTKTTLYPGLDEEFSTYLRDRAVLKDVAAERGYRLVRQGKPLDGDYAAAWGFPRKAAGLLIPLLPVLDTGSQPDTPFDGECLLTMPYGEQEDGNVAIGSLDLLAETVQGAFAFSIAEHVPL